MFELEINGQVYQFKFGMGFMREINKKLKTPIDGVKDATQNIGLRMAIASVLDGDVEGLVDLLEVANKTETPRVTKNLLDEYIDNEDTDIDKLFEDVKDFLSRANATKKTYNALMQMVEEEKAKKANG